MSNTETAKSLYRDICSVGGFRFGPHLSVDDTARRKLDSLRPSLLKTLSEIEIAGNRLSRAPSPWHAALAGIVALQYSLTPEGHPLKHGDETVIMSSKQSFVFRGQGDKNCDLIPKLERKEIDNVFEARALDAFCASLDRLFKSADIPTPPAKALAATAQHYGIATHLLDFTADPSVAVWFGAHAPRRRKDQEAVIFLLPLIEGLNRGAKIILPPPFVKRLYVQRGLFIEPAGGTGSTLRQACTEICFPLDSSFKVIREGKPIKLLLRDQWLEKCVEWAQKWAKAGKDFPKDPKVAESIYYEEFEEIGYPTYLRNGYEAMKQLALWVDFASEMLYWLGALVVYEDKEGLNLTIMDTITRDNRSLVETCATLLGAEALAAKKSGQTKFASQRSHYVKLLRDALQRTRLE